MKDCEGVGRNIAGREQSDGEGAGEEYNICGVIFRKQRKKKMEQA